MFEPHFLHRTAKGLGRFHLSRSKEKGLPREWIQIAVWTGLRSEKSGWGEAQAAANAAGVDYKGNRLAEEAFAAADRVDHRTANPRFLGRCLERPKHCRSAQADTRAEEPEQQTRTPRAQDKSKADTMDDQAAVRRQPYSQRS